MPLPLDKIRLEGSNSQYILSHLDNLIDLNFSRDEQPAPGCALGSHLLQAKDLSVDVDQNGRIIVYPHSSRKIAVRIILPTNADKIKIDDKGVEFSISGQKYLALYSPRYHNQDN
jgi:hypothetical protein